MHIAEGILSPPVLVGGAALALVGLARGLRAVDADNAPRIGLMAAALFVGALIHIPIGPVSLHLVLNGLAGLLLGWAAFPALAVALVLQALLFQFGGITTLGVNTATMAWPAVAVSLLLAPQLRRTDRRALPAAFAAGALAVAGSVLLTNAALYLTNPQAFLLPALVATAAHIPLMIAEGLICVCAVGFLRRVRPDLLTAGPIPQGA